ncbi:Ubiquinone biosynthesis O-methyltransferase, mitochondrial [Oligella ureolytica]
MSTSYERWRNSELGRITDDLEERLLLEMIGEPAGLEVLDVGCGDAVLLTKLAKNGASVAGMDIDPRMLQAASRESANGKCHYAVGARRYGFSTLFRCVL